MKIEMRGHGVVLTANEREYAEARLARELSHVAGWVRSVLVFVSDENGPKGGSDKTCRVAVSVGRRPIIIEHRAGDVMAALDAAADRVGVAVRRNLDRRRERRHGKLVHAVNAVLQLFGRKREVANATT
jgi:ribosome-associated translation inhibitor RaiA